MLNEAGVQATDLPSQLIEAFDRDWQKGWYVFNENGDWPYRTNKLQDPKWRPPDGATLLLEVQSSLPNKLVLRLDDFAAVRELAGGESWQTLTLNSADFQDALGNTTGDWRSASELVISFKESLKQNDRVVLIGADWQGPPPRFRNLRWHKGTPS
jgi:hypothetical protein